MAQNSDKNLQKDDEELARLAVAGDDAAFASLLGRYVFEVRSCAVRYNSCGIDFEDLVQEGTIGLLNAVKSFDSSCGASFKTFAKLCIDRNIISAVRAVLRKKQIPKSALVFIDDELRGIEGGENPENVIIEREEARMLWHRLFNCLSELELKVLKLFLQGSSYKEIAQQLGCTQKQVDNALARLRKKLKYGPIA